jgi:hypothetical protein
LAVQRRAIGVFGHQDLRHRGLGRQSALDQSGRCGCLHHHVFARPASILGAANDQYPELRRHDVEPLARILADPMQRRRHIRNDGPGNKRLLNNAGF